MFSTLKKFFDFTGKENARKFKKGIALGVVEAAALSLKIPAVMIILSGLINIENGGSAPVSHCIAASLLLMFLSIIISIFCKAKKSVLMTDGGYTCCAYKRIEIAEHMRYLPMGYFNKSTIGELSSTMTNTAEAIGDTASRVVMMTTQGILETLLLILFIFIFDWRIGIVALLGFLVFMMINSAMQRMMKSVSGGKKEADTVLISELLENIQGMAEVRSFGLFGKNAAKFNTANKNAARANFKMEAKCALPSFLQSAEVKLTGAAVVLFSALFFINGTMSLLTAAGMVISAFILFAALESFGTYSALLNYINLNIDKVNSVLSLPAMDTDGKDIELENCDIEAKDISFSYSDKKIIDGISLKIPEKSTAAIVGPSGGGKTTLCHLLARFWDVDSGEITLGGENIKDFSIDSLMRNFSFVFQDVYLFSDTIENNIKFGKSNATHEEVVEAAKKASCHEFIENLPDGYNTVIGEGGASLSGGEKQRISIARAIMKDAPIIILDEATANVDPENEAALMDAIASLTKGKTVIMIAHRLKTVRNAGRIFVIDKGRVAEKGTHDELLKRGGIYSRFVEARKRAVNWRI